MDLNTSTLPITMKITVSTIRDALIANYDIPLMAVLLISLLFLARYLNNNGFFIPLPVTTLRLPSLLILTSPTPQTSPKILTLPSHLQSIASEHLPKPPSPIPLADESSPGDIHLTAGHALFFITPSSSTPNRYALVVATGERAVLSRILSTHRPIRVPSTSTALCTPLPPNPSSLLQWRARNRLRAAARHRGIGANHVFMRARAPGCAAEHGLLVPASWAQI